MIGAFYLSLAVLLTLPIPLGNVLPALAISIIALGMIERNGVWILAGVAVGVAAMIVVGGVLWAMALAALFFFASIAGQVFPKGIENIHDGLESVERYLGRKSSG